MRKKVFAVTRADKLLESRVGKHQVVKQVLSESLLLTKACVCQKGLGMSDPPCGRGWVGEGSQPFLWVTLQSVSAQPVSAICCSLFCPPLA